MVIWGCTWRVRAVSAGLRRGAIGSLTCHRLPKACHRLPKPAITCHGLPVLWEIPGVRRDIEKLCTAEHRSACSRRVQRYGTSTIQSCVEITSAHTDLLLENGVKGIPCSVTVCHIETGDLQSKRWRALSGLGGTFRHRSPGRCPGLSSTAPLVLMRPLVPTMVVLNLKTRNQPFGAASRRQSFPKPLRPDRRRRWHRKREARKQTQITHLFSE